MIGPLHVRESRINVPSIPEHEHVCSRLQRRLGLADGRATRCSDAVLPVLARPGRNTVCVRDRLRDKPTDRAGGVGRNGHRWQRELHKLVIARSSDLSRLLAILISRTLRHVSLAAFGRMRYRLDQDRKCLINSQK